jgi:hypothetical protein
MRRVAPSVIAREQLCELLAGGVDRETNIVSALVEAVTRLVVQELVEAEQGDYLGGRGRYERRSEGQLGSRNGYERGRPRTAEGFVASRCRRCPVPRRRSTWPDCSMPATSRPKPRCHTCPRKSGSSSRP